MNEDEQLEIIRKKRLQQLQQQMALEEMDEKDRQEDMREAQRKLVLRRILTPGARERLARIKMARPEYEEAVENQLLMLARRLSPEDRIDDAALKKILQQLMPKKREINIERR